MIVLYDDRARQVIQNQGIVVGEEEAPLRPGEITIPKKEEIISNDVRRSNTGSREDS